MFRKPVGAAIAGGEGASGDGGGAAMARDPFTDGDAVKRSLGDEVAATAVGEGAGSGEEETHDFPSLFCIQNTCLMSKTSIATKGGKADIHGGGGERLGELVLDEGFEVNGRYLAPAPHELSLADCCLTKAAVRSNNQLGLLRGMLPEGGATAITSG